MMEKAELNQLVSLYFNTVHRECSHSELSANGRLRRLGVHSPPELLPSSGSRQGTERAHSCHDRLHSSVRVVRLVRIAHCLPTSP
jgi:hypothetical protein